MPYRAVLRPFCQFFTENHITRESKEVGDFSMLHRHLCLIGALHLGNHHRMQDHVKSQIECILVLCENSFFFLENSKIDDFQVKHHF